MSNPKTEYRTYIMLSLTEQGKALLVSALNLYEEKYKSKQKLIFEIKNQVQGRETDGRK